MEAVKNFFRFSENKTDLRTELAAGLTTFLTMSYIIFVQPAVLGAAVLAAMAALSARNVKGAVRLADGTFIHPVTAPALILVGALMMSAVRRVNWEDLSASIPAFVTLVLIPFTFNIADGIAFGFMAYVLIKTLSGRTRDIPPLLWVISALLAVRYAFLK